MNTNIKATVITDNIVKHIFQVWLKKYCITNDLHYKPRRNLLYTDIQKLAQIRANLPHLDPNTRAGFTDEMEFIQMRIENGTIHLLIDGTNSKNKKNSKFTISPTIMSHQFSKEGKLEQRKDQIRMYQHVIAFNCFSQSYLATPEDVAACTIPSAWYSPFEKDHANGNNGDNTMRNITLKEVGDNKAASNGYIRS